MARRKRKSIDVKKNEYSYKSILRVIRRSHENGCARLTETLRRKTSPERPGYRGSTGAKMRQNMKFLRRNLNFAEKTKEESD